MSRSLPQKEEVIIKNKEINTFASKSKSHQRIIDELIDDPNNNIPW
jgi:ribosomal protein L17